MMTRNKRSNQTQLTNRNNEEIPKNKLEVNIDFDEAIKEWRSNKKSIGNGHYKYICQVITVGKKNICEKSCYKGTNTCWIHRLIDRSREKLK
jgi:hypothetical protein